MSMDSRERKVLAALRFDAVPTEKTLWGGNLNHIDGFNQDVYDTVQAEIMALRPDRVDSPAGLVVHGEFGSGKSHLVWWARRFIARSGTGGYYFNVQPDGDPDTLWTRVVASMVNDLQRSVGYDESGESVTQLSLFMRRLAKRLGLPDRTEKVLSGRQRAEPDEAREHLNALLTQLRGPFRDVQLRNVALALALLSIADDDANVAAVEYLRDSPEEKQTRRDWGLRPVDPARPQDVVDHMSTLLALTGPSLFAVDQIDDLVVRSAHSTERAGSDETSADLMAALMRIRERLTRSITLISCLEHTWGLVKSRAAISAAERFPTVMQLKPVPSAAVARRLVANFLGHQFQQFNEFAFTAPHPTWPVPPEAFEAATQMRPRRIIQLVGEYVRACLAADELLPLSNLGARDDPAVPVADDRPDPVNDRYRDHRRTVRVDALKETSAEKQLGNMLLAAGAALLTESGIGGDYRIHDAARGAETPSAHGELVGPASRICVRGINTVHAQAVGSRLDNARQFADSEPDTRLVIVRTRPWKGTPRIRSALEAVEASGGIVIEISDDELRTLRAVELTADEDSDQTRAWLRQHRPVSGTGLGKTLLSLIDPGLAAGPAEPKPVTPGPDSTGQGSTAAVPDPEPQAAPQQSPPMAHPDPTPRRRPGNALFDAATPLEAGLPEPDASCDPGSIPLGRSTSGNVISVRLEELRKHVAVFAASGSGKTVLLRRIVEECALRGVSTIVLDPNNDLARLGDAWPSPPGDWWPGDVERARRYRQETDVVVWTPGKRKGNPLTLQPFPDFNAVRDDPDELQLAVDTAVASLAPRARIDGESHTADGRRAILRETLLEFARRGGGDLDGLIALLAEPPEEVLTLPAAVKHAEYVARALSYARSNDSLFDGEGTPFDPDRLLTPAGGKKARVSVINLSAIPDENRPAFVNRLQMTLFSWIKRHPAREKPLSGLFIMDEAQNFIPSGKNTPCTESTRNLASQARKYGLGLVYATQAPRGIDSRIVGNAASHVYGRVTVPAHINAVREIARSNKGEEPPSLSQLTRGRFYALLEGTPLTELTAPMCLSHHGSPLEESEITERARQTRG
jgi:hypothetical protein